MSKMETATIDMSRYEQLKKLEKDFEDAVKKRVNEKYFEWVKDHESYLRRLLQSANEEARQEKELKWRYFNENVKLCELLREIEEKSKSSFGVRALLGVRRLLKENKHLF
jgi:hypothetical protein